MMLKNGKIREYNSEPLLLEAFFHIIGISGSVKPQSECTLLFQYIIIF